MQLFDWGLDPDSFGAEYAKTKTGCCAPVNDGRGWVEVKDLELAATEHVDGLPRPVSFPLLLGALAVTSGFPSLKKDEPIVKKHNENGGAQEGCGTA